MSVMSVNMVDNKLVGRREVEVAITYKNPLTRDELKKVIGEHFKTDPSNIVIKKAVYSTGTKIIKVHAHIYDSPEKAKKIEPKHILIRNKLVEKEKK